MFIKQILSIYLFNLILMSSLFIQCNHLNCCLTLKLLYSFVMRYQEGKWVPNKILQMLSLKYLINNSYFKIKQSYTLIVCLCFYKNCPHLRLVNSYLGVIQIWNYTTHWTMINRIIIIVLKGSVSAS